MTNNKTKLAVVISHPIQHYAPVYEQLALNEQIELMVFFIAKNGVQAYFDEQFSASVKWDIDLLKGYPYTFIEPDKLIEDFSFSSVDSKQLVPALIKFQPDVVWLHGYAQKANWRVLFWTKKFWVKEFWAKRFGTKRRLYKQHKISNKQVKLLFSSDSNLSDYRAWYKKLIKQLIVRYFYGCCDRFLSIGKHNRTYLKHYGVANTQIQDTHFPIDMSRFIQLREALPKKSSEQIRGFFDIPGNAKILLFVGKLIPHKRPQDIIEALAVLYGNEKPQQAIYILYVGSGDMQEHLLDVAKQHGIGDYVKFAGFVNQLELVNYYNVADIFILPSEKEPYGAVVSESLPFGLPVIVSDKVGAIGSSAVVEHNAIVYDCGDVTQLANGINRLSNDDMLYQQMSQASLQQVDSHDSQQFAQAVAEACAILKNA